MSEWPEKMYSKVKTMMKGINCVGFEVLTAVVKKSTIFWDITPCSPLSVNRRLGGTYCLHLQGKKNNVRGDKLISKSEVSWVMRPNGAQKSIHSLLLASCLACSPTLKMEANIFSKMSGSL
jgi:hypothetical protein